MRIRREFNETKANADAAGIYKQRAKKKDKNVCMKSQSREVKAGSRVSLKIYDDITGLFIHLTSSGRHMS